MNNQFFFLIRRVIAGILLLSLLMLPYCGGGFKSDSPNAPQLEDTVFGKDTLME
ncbi:MAG: hypothetical protein JXA18_01345 [Chitinispirillaceae bacterium]|nr:hypothetical protein [Chitinispirillaceae bacterium]